MSWRLKEEGVGLTATGENVATDDAKINFVRGETQQGTEGGELEQLQETEIEREALNLDEEDFFQELLRCFAISFC